MPSERLIELPHVDRILSAAQYIAAIAFPEAGADCADSPRDEFTSAVVWRERERLREMGAGQAATALDAHAEKFSIPRRGLQTRLDRGFGRAYRSVITYGLYQHRRSVAEKTVNWERCASIDQINQHVPAWTELLSDKASKWREAFALNETGPGGGKNWDDVKWIKRRVLQVHSAAIPMVHGLMIARGQPADDSLVTVSEWLMASLREPSSWCDLAVEKAQLFRHHRYPRGGEEELRPERLLLPVWVVNSVVQYPHWVARLTDQPSVRPPHKRRRKPKELPDQEMPRRQASE